MIDPGIVALDVAKCWCSQSGCVSLPCDRPAKNGLGLCDEHLEIMREMAR